MSSMESLRPYWATFAREHDVAGYSRPESITIDCHGHMSVPESDKLVRPHLPASELDAVKYASSLNFSESKPVVHELQILLMN